MGSSNIVGIPSLAILSQTRKQIFERWSNYIPAFIRINNHCLLSTNSVHNRFRESILLPAVSVSMACASCHPLTTSQNCILPERSCNFWTESECHFVWEGWEPSSICKHFPLVNCAQFLKHRIHNLLRWLFSWRPPSLFVMTFSGNACCLRSGIASSQTFQLVESVYWLEVLNFKYWCIICLCDFNYFRVGPLISSRILTSKANLFLS